MSGRGSTLPGVARPDAGLVRQCFAMDTLVTVDVPRPRAGVDAGNAAQRALRWFAEVERVCSRFDPASELRRLCAQPGTPVPVSGILYRAVELALAVADATDGIFDPTCGDRMQRAGFDIDYRTGARTPAGHLDAGASWRDVVLDPGRQAITLRRRLLLDLGGLAKGLAIDLAAAELSRCRDFAINAGGDLYLAGRNGEGEHWSVGIRHPAAPGELSCRLRITDAAVCTSGGYERPAPSGRGHHLRTKGERSAAIGCAGATVVAPTASIADALATAAFLCGPEAGLGLLEREGVDGLLIGSGGAVTMTPLMTRYLQ